MQPAQQTSLGPPMYAAYYGLDRAPFDARRGDQDPVLPDAQLDALSSLLQAVVDRREVMAMTGEAGMGKTTLLRALRARIASQRTVIAVDVSTDPLTLIRAIATRLSLPNAATLTLAQIADVHAGLLIHGRAQPSVLLCVDDAQDASPELLEFLRFLASTQAGSQGLLQILLVGRKELVTRLQQPQMARLLERVAVHRRLDPLSDADARSYLALKLALAGGDLERTFAPRAIRALIRAGRGIPARLDLAAHEALGNGYTNGSRPVAAKYVGMKRRPPSRAPELPTRTAPAAGPGELSIPVRERMPATRPARSRNLFLGLSLAVLAALLTAYGLTRQQQLDLKAKTAITLPAAPSAEHATTPMHTANVAAASPSDGWDPAMDSSRDSTSERSPDPAAQSRTPGDAAIASQSPAPTPAPQAGRHTSDDATAPSRSKSEGHINDRPQSPAPAPAATESTTRTTDPDDGLSSGAASRQRPGSPAAKSETAKREPAKTVLARATPAVPGTPCSDDELYSRGVPAYRTCIAPDGQRIEVRLEVVSDGDTANQLLDRYGGPRGESGRALFAALNPEAGPANALTPGKVVRIPLED